MPTNGHDAKGRFTRGNPGGPGNPYARQVAALRKVILNRLTEEITEEDRRGDPAALWLQRIFLLIYGWQDRLIARIDRWCMGEIFDETHLPLWYSDRFGLRL